MNITVNVHPYGQQNRLEKCERYGLDYITRRVKLMNKINLYKDRKKSASKVRCHTSNLETLYDDPFSI